MGPPDAAVVEAGAACGQGLPICGDEAFCATGSFDGVTVVHNCLPRGGCNACGCLYEIMNAYIRANRPGSSYEPAACGCTTTVDGTLNGTAISITCNIG